MSIQSHHQHTVREIDQLEELDGLRPLDGEETVVFQGLDLRGHDQRVVEHDLRAAVFLGCHLGPLTLERADRDGALQFPRLDRFPFEPYRNRLYSPEELFAGYRRGDPDSYQDTLDGRVYAHFVDTGRSEPPSILENLARRLHDHAITDALHELLVDARVVAVMGGHATSRAEPRYREVALISKRLTAAGFLMASGGGPGAMEATHLGACFAHREESELDAAVESLALAPRYTDRAWLETAMNVLEELRRGEGDEAAPMGRSLGIPTWTYGHEPPTVFASEIAKYFANSVREAGLLAIARSGVVFAPGSAGTLQEVFQDAAQNHYETAGPASPMLFLDATFWRQELPAVPLLERLAGDRPYRRWMRATDSIEEIVESILDFDCKSSPSSVRAMRRDQ